jgi:hypothetical protein
MIRSAVESKRLIVWQNSSNLSEARAVQLGHERRYPIQSHDAYSFYTGFSLSNEQVLVGVYCPTLVALWFDVDGSLLRTSHLPIPFFQRATPPYDIYDDRLPPLIEAWKQDMELRPATIKVKKFFAEQWHIGIEDYPAHFEEVLSDPAADEDEKADMRDSMELWDKDGQFVLLWGNDYWLNDSGEVVSS